MKKKKCLKAVRVLAVFSAVAVFLGSFLMFSAFAGSESLTESPDGRSLEEMVNDPAATGVWTNWVKVVSTYRAVGSTGQVSQARVLFMCNSPMTVSRLDDASGVTSVVITVPGGSQYINGSVTYRQDGDFPLGEDWTRFTIPAANRFYGFSEDRTFSFGMGGASEAMEYFSEYSYFSYSGDVTVGEGLGEFTNLNDWSYDLYGSRLANSNGERKYLYPSNLVGFAQSVDPDDCRMVIDRMTGQYDLHFRMKLYPSTGQSPEDFQAFCENLHARFQISKDNGQTWGDEINPENFFLNLIFPWRFQDHPAGFDNKEIVLRFKVGDDQNLKIRFIWMQGDSVNRIDEWSFVAYAGVVDQNGDGIDDRTQERDGDGNIISDGTGDPIDGGLGGSDGFDLEDAFKGVRSFFQGMRGIIPAPLLDVIVAGMAFLLVIGLIRVVTG